MVKAGKWGLCIVALIVLVGVAVALLVQELSCPAVGSDPADIEGVWHHSALNCLEGGPNILVFEGGKCFNYSSIHKTYELVGGYERLPGGKYKLTGNILLKSSSEAGKWFKEIYEKRKSEFPNVTIHPNGDITDIMTTILEPTRRHMYYVIANEKRVKLKRVTEKASFKKIHEEFSGLLKSEQDAEIKE